MAMHAQSGGLYRSAPTRSTKTPGKQKFMRVSPHASGWCTLLKVCSTAVVRWSIRVCHIEYILSCGQYPMHISSLKYIHVIVFSR